MKIISTSGVTKYVGPLIFFTLTLILWELLVDIFKPPRFLAVGPFPVFSFLVSEWKLLWTNAVITILEIFYGYLIGVILGSVIAIAITYIKFLRLSLYPIILGAKVVPKIAIAPLLFLWLGYDIGPKAILVALTCFFPIVINMTFGLNSVDRELLELAHSFSASGVKTLVKIRFPYALPCTFAGLKVAATLSTVGATVAEFVGGSFGLGFLINEGLETGRSVQMFAAVMVIFAIGIIFLGIILLIERVTIPWFKAEKSRVYEEGIA